MLMYVYSEFLYLHLLPMTHETLAVHFNFNVARAIRQLCSKNSRPSWPSSANSVMPRSHRRVFVLNIRGLC
jgi:hypothetical protein